LEYEGSETGAKGRKEEKAERQEELALDAKKF
jgi:hypothetical protein